MTRSFFAERSAHYHFQPLGVTERGPTSAVKHRWASRGIKNCRDSLTCALVVRYGDRFSNPPLFHSENRTGPRRKVSWLSLPLKRNGTW